MSALFLKTVSFASFATMVIHGSKFEVVDDAQPPGDLPGAALEHLIQMSQEGNGEGKKPGPLRLKAFDLLSATTDMPDQNTTDFQKFGKMENLPAATKEDGTTYKDKLETEAQTWVEQSESVYTHAQDLRDEADKALALVVNAADSFSALAKGLHFTASMLDKDAPQLKDVFNDEDKWNKYLEDLEKKNIIDSATVKDWQERPFDATDTEAAKQRKQFVSQYLGAVMQDKDGQLPMKLMKDFDIPEWYEVELDWLKEYAKLFNSEGRNGPSPNRGGHRNTTDLQSAEEQRTGANRHNTALERRGAEMHAEGHLGGGSRS
jgi:hypothetical protein